MLEDDTILWYRLVMPPLYKAETVRKVCPGVTLRMLDHWVMSNVVQPAYFLETNRRKRKIYLFDFENIVQIRIVKSLREAGVSLQKIRVAIGKLRSRGRSKWQSAWLVTDGRAIYEGTDDPAIVESLSKQEPGQLAFSVVAVGETRQRVEKILRTCDPIEERRYDAKVKRWNKTAG